MVSLYLLRYWTGGGGGEGRGRIVRIKHTFKKYIYSGVYIRSLFTMVSLYLLRYWTGGGGGGVRIVRIKNTFKHYIYSGVYILGHSLRLTARVLLYASSHRQDSTYHSLCYTNHGALAGMRHSSMGPP